MTTIHAFTGDQRTLDTLHSDPRRARTASASLIPTSTGAAKAVGLVLPELAGKLDGTSVRVPSQNVSLIDLTFIAGRNTTAEEVNGAMEKASKLWPAEGRSRIQHRAPGLDRLQPQPEQFNLRRHADTGRRWQFCPGLELVRQ